MSEERISPDSNEAKLNARKNILQALEGSRTLSPTLPVQVHQSKVKVVDASNERQQHAVGLVKALQLEAKNPPSSQPPAPKPRSPRHSPTNRFNISIIMFFWESDVTTLIAAMPLYV